MPAHAPSSSRSGRLRQERHAQGKCADCGTPVARDPKTHLTPWQCAPCRLKSHPRHKQINMNWRDKCRATGKCVECGRPVERTNPHTGLPYTRCLNCARTHHPPRPQDHDDDPAAA